MKKKIFSFDAGDSLVLTTEFHFQFDEDFDLDVGELKFLVERFFKIYMWSITHPEKLDRESKALIALFKSYELYKSNPRL